MQIRTSLLAAGAILGAVVVARAAHAQADEYQPPQCELNTSHFLVKNTVVYIKGASEEQDPAKRQEMLASAQQNLLQAISTDQADNPAAWYFLGRYYAMTDDPAGADSAFRRAEQLAPDCNTDITYYRMVMWAPRINEAIDSLNQGDYDAAKRLFRGANKIYDADNIGYYYLAVLYGQENELDSARHYFTKVAAVGAKDSTRERNVEVSTYNAALLYGADGQWDSALVWYEKYRELIPNDPQGIAGLATTYAELGVMDRAASLYDSVFAMADSLTMHELFDAGQRLFEAGRLALAAEAFATGLKKNPYHRDGLYNLTNSYLSLAQDSTVSQVERYEAAQGMEQAARRLTEVEPLGHEAFRLLAAAFRLRQLNDSTLAVLQRVEDMSFGIEVYQAERFDSSMTIRGTISNMKNRVAKVPAITFEFLDVDGNVLASEPIPVTDLQGHGTQDFEVTGAAENIAAWRYTVGT